MLSHSPVSRALRRGRVIAAVTAAAIGLGAVTTLLPSASTTPASAQTASCSLLSRAEVQDIFSLAPLRESMESNSEADPDSSAVANLAQCEFVFDDTDPLAASITITQIQGAFNFTNPDRFGSVFRTSDSTHTVDGLGDQAVITIVRIEGLDRLIAVLNVRLGNDILTAGLRLPSSSIDDDTTLQKLKAMISLVQARLSQNG